MAENQNVGFVVKSSINVKSMGDPRKVIANLPDGKEVDLLGTIIGIAQGVNRRADPKGGPDYVGLTGAFSAIPADAKRDEVRSTICYLPDAVHGPIAATLEKAKENNPTATVRFAMEASVRKGGTAGFTWEYKPLFDGAAGVMVDPLSEIRKAVTGGAKALPAPTAAETKAIEQTAAQTTQSRFDKPAEAKGAARK